MDQQLVGRITRFGAWSGVAYVACICIGWGLVAGFFPPWDPMLTADQLTTAYASDTIKIRIGMLIAMFGAMMFLPFAATLSSYVARYEGRFGILAILTAMGGFGSAMFAFFPPLWWIVLLYRPRSPEITQLFNDLSWMTFLGAGTLAAPVFLMPAVMAFTDKSETPLFPRWVGWFNVFWMLGSVSGQMLFFFKDGVFAWNGLLSFWMPAYLTLTWLCIVVYFMDRAARATVKKAASVDQLEPHLRH